MAKMSRQVIVLEIDRPLDSSMPDQWDWAALLDEPEECVRLAGATRPVVVEVDLPD